MGLYKWERLSIDLASAPGAFKKLILNGLSHEIALVYLHDIIIFGRTFQEHLERLELILCRLKEAGLKVKESKCRFFQKKFIFSDILCQTTAITIHAKKVDSILASETSNSFNVKQSKTC